ncbi:MAG: HNH endonuclease [Dehalococcoidia bacterium]
MLRERVIREEGSKCAKCRRWIRDKIDITVDHILPRSRYPELALQGDNLCVLCRSCNSRKGNRD